MSTYFENDKLKKWVEDFYSELGQDAQTELDIRAEKGLLELYGHKCSECGRTWLDEDDDNLTICSFGEGCNS